MRNIIGYDVKLQKYTGSFGSCILYKCEICPFRGNHLHFSSFGAQIASSTKSAAIMQYGFLDKNGRSQIPLEKIQIRSLVKGFTCEVVATIDYKNNSDNPIEAIYVFPLDEEATVCGFQATIDGRTIVAEIQGKQEARDTYDDAISSGQSAFLLEESDESSDIFQINVGNLPPRESATVELKFVTTLKVEKEGKVVFVLPTVLNPRYTPSDSEASISTTTHSLASVNTKYSFDFEMNVQCASPIQEITSPCNKLHVDVKRDDKKEASVRLAEDYKFDCDVQVHILWSQPYEPHAIIEGGSATSDEYLSKSVAMVNLFPEFDSSASLERGEFIFVVDRSGSMSGSNIKSARETLLLFLKSLPEDCYFNIVGFGSSFEKLFKTSERYNDDSLKTACSHGNNMEANLGGTEILRPLEYVFAVPLIKGYPRQVFVLTDGDVGNTNQVIDLVKSNASKARCFAFGIGAGASTALVKGVARAGKGTAEFVASGDKLNAKVIKVLKNALQPALLDCEVTWDLPEGCTVETVPDVIPPVFSGNSLIIYGIISGSKTAIKGSVTIATSLIIGSSIKKIQHKVSLDGSREGPDDNQLLHRLAAKMFIQEKQDSNSDGSNDEMIVKMSKSANVVSKQTSFVAVDKESKKPITAPLMARQAIDDFYYGACFDGLDEQCDSLAIPRCAKQKKRSSLNPFSGLGNIFKPKKSASNRSSQASVPKRMFKRSRAARCVNDYDPTIEDGDEDEDLDDENTQGGLSQVSAQSQQKGCLQIVSLQKASGSWQLTDELAKSCESTLDKLQQSCPLELTSSTKDSLWATALALACLHGKFPGQKDEWEMVAAKGAKWLQANLPIDTLSYDQILQMAATILCVTLH